MYSKVARLVQLPVQCTVYLRYLTSCFLPHRHPHLVRSGPLQLHLSGSCLEERNLMCPFCRWSCSPRSCRWRRSRAGRLRHLSLLQNPVLTSPSLLGFNMCSLLSLPWQTLVILPTFLRGAFPKQAMHPFESRDVYICITRTARNIFLVTDSNADGRVGTFSGDNLAFKGW